MVHGKPSGVNENDSYFLNTTTRPTGGRWARLYQIEIRAPHAFEYDQRLIRRPEWI